MEMDETQKKEEIIPITLDDSPEANEYVLTEIDKKIKDFFPGESINKKLTKKGILSSRALPSFVTDWLISKFSSDEKINAEGLQNFLDEYLPDKSKSEQFKFKIKNDRKKLSILANFLVTPDIKSDEDFLEIPILDIKGKEGVAVSEVIKNNPDLLNGGSWGVGDLTYEPPEPGRKDGKIILRDFTPFRPFKVNLDYYRNVRSKNFTTLEWIDFLLKNMEYEPKSFDSIDSKLKMISRLLPFVEPRVNLIELAPKGTGKSYVFGRLSKYGWLISGGTISRAQLFYDMGRKRRGLITRFDYIALDEIQTINFGSNPDEVVGALKGYLESGAYNVASHPGEADASFVILGNIPIGDVSHRPLNNNYFETLPKYMQESALIDRFHGFIEGWKLPRIKIGSIGKGYALNSEFFSEILHTLREDTTTSAVVDMALDIPKTSDKRDATAISRISTGFLKLLFPHVRSTRDLDLNEFETYCFGPAYEMREIIREQLHRMDPEFPEKMPKIKVKSKM